ncbi:hypothetical protein N7481_012352 [Penicillium waksmanii]|uniref:uncharacterized protein n=1 Tax=Penicillium waksmanii TaxID=69791 RepID=UPI0025495F95|nr:uncharacterized protein N7481_012352 [Penicillium waksmanii]KAJ5965638.1 hypothetical protein N7481_012352 [Penicillium waksmanii]
MIRDQKSPSDNAAALSRGISKHTVANSPATRKMRLFSQLAIRSIVSLSICSGAFASTTSTSTSTADPVAQNANHIFNVIHDSMRQWGSSLHHNGVSFFLASVPVGTQLYHGTSNPDTVTGMEWLAFEPEHAMALLLTRSRRTDTTKNYVAGMAKGSHHLGNSDENESGYLHTYAAAKDLRLVYIDGMSAGKTKKGTLDSQDYVLFNGTIEEFSQDKKPRRGPGGPGGEKDRAVKACEMAQNEWEGQIDGVLRMEAGFEIILCSFERDLTPVRTTQVKKDTGEGGKRKDFNKPHGPPGGDKKRKGHGPGGPGPDSSRWMRAVTARYDSIGGNRVSLNYDHFVTAYSYDFNLFANESVLPRLAHLSSTERAAIRDELTSLILSNDTKESSWNWQATADMIVTRYSDELSYLASEKFLEIKAFRDHIELLLSPFIDYSKRNISDEAERCATQFLPFQTQKEQTLPARAVHHVAHSVCLALLEAGNEEKLSLAQNRVSVLVDYLDWTTWKECRGCEDNEICVIPIWPMGTVSDYNNPKCRDASKPYEGDDGEGYWGGMH